jgi:hypothetical protein
MLLAASPIAMECYPRMLQIDNQTPFRAERALLRDARGSQVWVVAVKATYAIGGGGDDGEPKLHDEQEPVAAGPVWAGEPGRSSLLREGELVVEHPGTDVTFNAAAHARGGRPVDHVDVGVTVGGARRLLRVFGERLWQKGAGGPKKDAPAPFARMPIVWERAFGGTLVDPRTGAVTMDPRNPVGRGFAPDPTLLEGKLLPNVEDLQHPIESWKSRPPPAGLGAIAPGWSPRSERGGTYDEAWRRSRMPLWPADYDPRFHQSAPPELVCETPLRGGEEVRTTGLTPDGELAFRLPRVHLAVETLLGGEWLFQRSRLERVIVEPDERRLVLVWGSRLDCGTRGREVERTRISQKVTV